MWPTLKPAWYVNQGTTARTAMTITIPALTEPGPLEQQSSATSALPDMNALTPRSLR